MPIIVDLAPFLDFLVRLLLIGVTAGLVAFIAVRYFDLVLLSSFYGLYEGAGCYIAICLGLVLVAVLVSYWVF